MADATTDATTDAVPDTTTEVVSDPGGPVDSDDSSESIATEDVAEETTDLGPPPDPCPTDNPVYIMAYAHHYLGGGGIYPRAADIDAAMRTIEGTARSIHVFADHWRALWKLHDARDFPIQVAKVKAHSTEADLLQGYPVVHREGNGFADAAAKLGLSHHPRDRGAGTHPPSHRLPRRR